MGLGIPPLQIKIVLKSNPPKSRSLARRSAAGGAWLGVLRHRHLDDRARARELHDLGAGINNKNDNN